MTTRTNVNHQCNRRRRLRFGSERCIRLAGHHGGHVFASSNSAITAYMAGFEDGRAAAHHRTQGTKP